MGYPGPASKITRDSFQVAPDARGLNGSENSLSLCRLAESNTPFFFESPSEGQALSYQERAMKIVG